MLWLEKGCLASRKHLDILLYWWVIIGGTSGYVFGAMLSFWLEKLTSRVFRKGWIAQWSTLVYLPFFFFFLLFKSVPVAHGSSQARGWIRAAAAGPYHSHSNVGSEPHLQPTPPLWQCQILNPRKKARNQTRILMDTGWVLNPPSRNGNSSSVCF